MLVGNRSATLGDGERMGMMTTVILKCLQCGCEKIIKEKEEPVGDNHCCNYHFGWALLPPGIELKNNDIVTVDMDKPTISPERIYSTWRRGKRIWPK